MGKGLTLLEGETLGFERKCNARIPQGRKHKLSPGTLYVTDRRLVHHNTGLFGIGSVRHEIPLRRVSTVNSARGSGVTTVEVVTLDGASTRFTLTASDAEQVMTLVNDSTPG